MKTFLSGWQATNAEREKAVIDSGWMHGRCFSFALLHKIPGLPSYNAGVVGALQACLNSDVEVMLDSGVVSWRSHKASCEKKSNQKALDKLCGEKEFIQLYVDYVKTKRHKLFFYVSVDLDRIAKNILERHKRILDMGIKPVPVFHGDDSIDFIKKYADLGHDLIAIASWKTLRTNKDAFKRYLYNVFNTADKWSVKLHGLAFTSPWAMVNYPWYSVDSSSWSRFAGFGAIIKFNSRTHRLFNIRISRRRSNIEYHIKTNPPALEELREEVAAEGFDLEQLRDDFVLRHIYNARTMHLLTEYATKRHGGTVEGFSSFF